ncbi:MAG: Smr/MutS family protein [Chloroflexota bacterium]
MVKSEAMRYACPEVDLHSLRADEALIRLDLFLNEAFVSGSPWVRVIHGEGTGALRQAVQGMLRHHPLVKSFRSGVVGEGGAGVTLAELQRR